MTSLRKHGSNDTGRTIYGRGRVAARVYPPEAFDYNDDCDPAIVRQIESEAADLMNEEGWEVIDGHAGSK